MRILIAEDDAISQRLLEGTLTKWGHEVILVGNGAEALRILQSPNAPHMAVVDWMMPEMDGVQVCHELRRLPSSQILYLILLTSKGQREDIVMGLEAGADDYLVKPFDRAELRARINTGIRIVELQAQLAERVKQLEEALASVHQLQGLLPICCYCKRVRDDNNYWQEVENYVSHRSGTMFTHGVCPDCRAAVVESDRQEAHPVV
jgi:DNA-binding response OmpR family regulator